MSKVPFNPKTAAHALRGLAFGTSCSLVLVSEERRRRVDLARTLVENGRLIKAQRCYTTADAAVAIPQLERASDDPTIEGDTPSKPDSPWPGVEPAERRSAPPTPIPRYRHVQHPIFPGMQKDSTARVTPVATMGSSSLNRNAVSDKEEGQVQEPAPATPFPMSGNNELSAFARDLETVQSLPNFPPEFLESTMALLRTLEQQDDVAAAQVVLDRLCHHPATNSRNFDTISTEFLLRCLLSGRGYTDALSRSGRRFKLAAFLFWARRKLLATPEETDELIKLVAELFAVEGVEHEIQSFLATSHLRFGRHITAKQVVVPVAKLYRARVGRAAALDRWLELAEKAGVPMGCCRAGSSLMKWWETEDGLRETGPRRDPCIPKLRKELRFSLPFDLEKLSGEQRGLFDRMNEKAEKGEWRAVLDCHSEGLGGGVEASVACLRLAVEAAVVLEDIHTPRALKLIEEAHGASLDVNPVIQTLLVSRFDSIGNYQQANRTPETRGQAYKAMQKLLDTVRPYYERPSEIVYNHDIRVCIRVAELKEARELCLLVAQEYWDGDVMHKPFGFVNLLTIAVRTKDWALLRRMLEAIPWKGYRVQPMCKTALKDARSTLQAMMKDARSTEASLMYEHALGNVEIALQSVMASRASNHKKVKTQIRYKAVGPYRSRKERDGERSVLDGAKATTSSAADSGDSSPGLTGWLAGSLQEGERACKRVLGW